MSHISILKTNLMDRDQLIEALKALGYPVTTGENLVIESAEKTVKVDFLVTIPYSAPVGFRLTKNGFQAVADWFRVIEKKKTFLNQIKQQYALLTVTKTADSQGFSIVKEENEAGRIHIVLRRMT